MEKKQTSRKRRWIKWSAIGLGSFVVLSVASVETTSQSWFCNSCHIMEPFYTSWKESAHGDVGCVKCHITPGVNSFLEAKLNGLGQVVDDALNRTSNKPSAAVSQMACLRSGCHSVETVSNTNIFNDKFQFKHGKHVGKEYYGIKIGCTTCHSHVKGDTHFEVNTTVCITCHLTETDGTTQPLGAGKEITYNGGMAPIIRLAVRDGHAAEIAGEELNGRPPAKCKTCHQPPSEPFEYRGMVVDHEEYLSYGAACESCHRDTTAQPQPIDDGSCLACHTFGIEEVMPTEEIHRAHAEGRHKIECFSCHGTPRHGPAAQTMTLEQFDCRGCHQDQHQIQRQAYLHDVDAPEAGEGVQPVSPMFMAHVDCTGCHISPSPLSAHPAGEARVARAVPAACDTCHEPGLGDQMIPLWQQAARGLFDKTSGELAVAEKTVQGSEAVQLLEQAKGLLDLVEMDGSWGVHNPRYTQSLLERARGMVTAARAQGAAPDGGAGLDQAGPGAGGGGG